MSLSSLLLVSQIQPQFRWLIVALSFIIVFISISNSVLNFAILVIPIAFITTSWLQAISARCEKLKIFDKGNVPSLPNSNPITGNYFQLIASRNNVLLMESYHKKLGKTYGFFYGPDPWVLSTDLDLLYRLFVTDSNKFTDVTDFRLPFMTEINKSLAQIKGDDWRRLRRAFNPSFASRQMKSDNVFTDIEEATTRLLKCIDEHPKEKYTNSLGDEKEAKVIDVLYNSKKYSTEVIFQVAHGRANVVNMNPGEKDSLIETIRTGSELISGPVVWLSVMFNGTQRFLGYLAKFTPIGRCIASIHKELDSSLEQRRKSHKNFSTQNRKMIDTIIESMVSNKLDDETLKANLFILFVTGYETTANTLAILLWLLTRHPEVQEKLRSELLIEGERCKYLDLCIKETLRLYPAVPSGIGRVLTEDVTFRGMTLFKGTSVNASIYSIHRMKEYWGRDAHLFRPERFEELTLHPAQYFAFGHGPRHCIGSNLALAEIRFIVTTILLRYRLENCPTTPESIKFTTPNIVHMIIEDRLDIRFVDLNVC